MNCVGKKKKEVVKKVENGIVRGGELCGKEDPRTKKGWKWREREAGQGSQLLPPQLV